MIYSMLISMMMLMAVQENVWVCKSKRVSIQMTVLSSASLGAVHIHLVLFGGGGKGKGKG